MFYQSARSLETFLKATSTVWFCFHIAFLYFVIDLLHFLPKSSTTVKRRWNGSTATLIPAFEGNNKRINILISFKPLKCG